MPLKNIETKRSVKEYVSSIKNENIKKDAQKLIKTIKEITRKKPRIWGEDSFIGFGKYKYKRKGKNEELEWFNIGLAIRKDKITLYLTCYLEKEPLIKELGKCKWGKGCLHIKNLKEINLKTLEKLILKYKDSSWY